MGEIDLDTFNERINTPTPKERVEPPFMPIKSDRNDDVNIDVGDGSIEQILKEPLVAKIDGKNKASYADVVRREKQK